MNALWNQFLLGNSCEPKCQNNVFLEKSYHVLTYPLLKIGALYSFNAFKINHFMWIIINVLFLKYFYSWGYLFKVIKRRVLHIHQLTDQCNCYQVFYLNKISLLTPSWFFFTERNNKKRCLYIYFCKLWCNFYQKGFWKIIIG